MTKRNFHLIVKSEASNNRKSKLISKTSMTINVRVKQMKARSKLINILKLINIIIKALNYCQ
jgi:hypothetical protein